mgnify:FL=1
MNCPYDLSEQRVSAINHLRSLPGDPSSYHTNGCTCDVRERPRDIVAKYPDHGCELWACLRCRGLYFRQSLAADVADAPMDDGGRDHMSIDGVKI